MPDGYVTGLGGILYCNQPLFLSARVGSGHETSSQTPCPAFHSLHFCLHMRGKTIGYFLLNNVLTLKI